MTAMMTGMVSTRGLVTAAASSAVSGAASGIRAHYSTFSSAGVYLGSGLVIGINSMRSAAYNAGYALGQAAAQGEKDGQASHSPSKLTIQAGKWLGEGLIIGIEQMGKKVYNAGYSLGDGATNSISKAINKAGGLINGDMDIQPTISPVIDLTNVENGVSAINGMLDTRRTIGVMSNLNSISSRMSERNQNGGFNDVVIAINKLRKELGNLEKPSYNINGVTYDDGSNISEAVQSLVRAARLERRI